LLRRWRPRGSTRALERQPAIGAVRVGGPVGRTELAQIGRRIDLGEVRLLLLVEDGQPVEFGEPLVIIE